MEKSLKMIKLDQLNNNNKGQFIMILKHSFEDGAENELLIPCDDDGYSCLGYFNDLAVGGLLAIQQQTTVEIIHLAVLPQYKRYGNQNRV